MPRQGRGYEAVDTEGVALAKDGPHLTPEPPAEGPAWCRRLVVAAAALLVSVLVSVLVGALVGAVTPGEPAGQRGEVLSTPDGPVRGVIAGNRTHVYYRIPHARPPVGRLRWNPPTVVEPWQHTLEADTPGAGCLQSGSFTNGEVWGSEDCLYVNVYSPAVAAPLDAAAPLALLPTLVYFHGGSFGGGSPDGCKQIGAPYTQDLDTSTPHCLDTRTINAAPSATPQLPGVFLRGCMCIVQTTAPRWLSLGAWWL